MRKLSLSVTVLIVCLTPDTAMAYVGPGAGITMLAALWGVLLAIGATIGAVLYWPIRSMLRKRKRKNQAKAVEARERSQDRQQGNVSGVERGN